MILIMFMTLGTRHNIAQHCKKNQISPLLTECWKVDEHILGQPEGQLILREGFKKKIVEFSTKGGGSDG